MCFVSNVGLSSPKTAFFSSQSFRLSPVSAGAFPEGKNKPSFVRILYICLLGGGRVNRVVLQIKTPCRLFLLEKLEKLLDN